MAGFRATCRAGRQLTGALLLAALAHAATAAAPASPPAPSAELLLFLARYGDADGAPLDPAFVESLEPSAADASEPDPTDDIREKHPDRVPDQRHPPGASRPPVGAHRMRDRSAPETAPVVHAPPLRSRMRCAPTPAAEGIA